MNLSNYREMDPSLVYSIVNTRLRDIYPTFTEFIDIEELDETDFLAFMEENGFAYQEELHQFRLVSKA